MRPAHWQFPMATCAYSAISKREPQAARDDEQAPCLLRRSCDPCSIFVQSLALTRASNSSPLQPASHRQTAEAGKLTTCTALPIAGTARTYHVASFGFAYNLPVPDALSRFHVLPALPCP